MLSKAVLAVCVSSVAAYVDRGILKLDNTTFDRLIDGGRNVIVRFDKEYSYGDEHDAWKEFAKTVGESSADMLVGDVGVSEYGDKDNSDLSERFKIGTDDFPQFRLWTKGKDSTAEPVKFSGAKKSEEFMKFIQSNAGVWVGLPGQVKELDSLAKEFGSAKDKASIIAKAGKLKLDEKDAESAKYYTKVMTKAAKDAEFVKKEVSRLTKMMDDGSVKADKKTQFGRRLNMLSSFE
jgi:endoplasmic reticulum protein 29